jgi:hypothetical protein
MDSSYWPGVIRTAGDQPLQVIDALAHNSQRDWETTVKDSVQTVESSHSVARPD